MADMKRRSKNNGVAPRYGIAEWYGNDITKLTSEIRNKFSLQFNTGKKETIPICPYLSTLIPNAQCNKNGGVCSIRPFSSLGNGSGIPVSGEKVVTTCPSRFLQTVPGHKSIFSWISKIMLEIDNPIIVKETPFLRSITDIHLSRKDVINTDEKEEDKKAGRIDWILVNPNTLDSSELEWCAVETQALYFSGNKMSLEFDSYSKKESKLLFPIGKRRPDYRSSGPKRLSPQLDVKVPVLRTWGKKVVVVIDSYFFEQMSILEDAFPRAKNDKERRDNADVIWFVVDFDSELNLIPAKVIFSTLEGSRRALNAAEPLSKGDFTKDLREVITNEHAKFNKVFRV